MNNVGPAALSETGAYAMGDTVVFGSCDTKYYRLFGKPFITSALHNNNHVHVHIINPEADITLYDHPKLRYTFEYNSPDTKEYYACNRFLKAPTLLTDPRHEDVRWLILDIDCLVRRPVRLPSSPVALFLRTPEGDTDWIMRASRVAAGAVMYSREGLPFAEDVARRIQELPNDWLVDQVALGEAYDQFSGVMPIENLNSDPLFMDWMLFEEEAMIWTGKGPRKYGVPRYVEETAYWANRPLAERAYPRPCSPDDNATGPDSTAPARN